MSEEKKTGTEVSAETNDGGRIVFADDVVATIASLAVADVEGVSALSGGVVEGITEMLGKKNMTKGVKVEVGTEEAAVDVSVIVKYGYKIKEVCEKIQLAVKNAIETMTGLKVVEINVFVQSIAFEPVETPAQKAEKRKAAKEEAAEAKKAAEPLPEPPRVK
ncbi:hypothetical protein SDC9_78061 [bioreactor metagenome]|jgi:uncharacterized alkaline shock family protein YloU|uniref:Alkaline shock protein 23 n=1 Tax=bioreactor metagenome TaxID=1076179 RepID=A0A644YSL7_9ZZZZ